MGESPSYPAVSPGVKFELVLELPAGVPTSIHRYGDAPSQFTELWLPTHTTNNTKEDAPIVAFIHGGCWLSEYNIEHSHALATALSQDGFAVWNIEYRRVGEADGGWPGSLKDIQAALALLHSLDPEGVDVATLVVAGHSAGGHLALLSAGAAPAIGLAPIIDIAGYAGGTNSCNAAAVQFMGAAPSAIPIAYRAATPIPRDKDTILMGRQDHIVPAQNQYLPTDYQQWSDAGHFDWIHPGTPAWQEFLAQLGKRQP